MLPKYGFCTLCFLYLPWVIDPSENMMNFIFLQKFSQGFQQCVYVYLLKKQL